MNEPVLIARLHALSNELDIVSEILRGSTWTSKEGEPRAEMQDSLLWIGLEASLIKDIDTQKRLINIALERTKTGIIDPEALKKAWDSYGTLFGRSQEILREGLEIIGMLAIRNSNLDNQILRVADTLIHDTILSSMGEEYYYLLVHGMHDSFTRTRSRILHLRFPEWTIWTLPLTIHDVGPVVVRAILEKEKNMVESEWIAEDERTMKPFVDNLRAALVNLHPEWTQLIQTGKLDANTAAQWAESRVQVFLADAFATYTMGPAYACAAIFLRLDPGLKASQARPSDQQRAQVILGMLAWASENTGTMSKPYSGIIDLLKEYWSQTLRYVEVDPEMTPDLQNWLQQLPDDFNKFGVPYLMGKAKYETKGTIGWKRAETWAEEWMEQLKKGELSLPEDSVGELRDVLNATWNCRLQIVQDIQKGEDSARANDRLKKLQAIGKELCDSIMITTAKAKAESQTRSSVQTRGGGT